MKITDVEPICLRIPPLDASCTWGDDAFLVRIHTDEGIVGIGESDTSPICARAFIDAPHSNLHCMGLRRILLGENPLEIQRLWDKMYAASNYSGRRGLGIHAISAVDIALWDIAGQYYGVPVHTLLGGKYRDTIQAYGTFIPTPSDEENRSLVRSLLKKGYTSLKFGGGVLGDDPEQDIAIIAGICEEAGGDAEIAIDLATKWGHYQHAAYMLERLKSFPLKWVEEPLPSDCTYGIKRLERVQDTPIAGGEDLTTQYEFESYMKATGVSIIQPDITRCGGISEMRRIHALSRRYAARLIPHGFSTGILLAATAHFLASIPEGTLIEYSQSKSPLFCKLVKNLIPFRDGRISVPSSPGLGVELDESVIEAYRM